MAPAQTVFAPKVAAETATARSPADVYGALFRAVQQQHVFADGKTFVDAVPKRAADAIMAAREWLRDPHFALRAADELGVVGPWPPQYERAARRR